MQYTRSKWLYAAITAFLVTVPLAGAGLYFKTHLITLLNQDALFRYVVRNMTESEKKEYYTWLAEQLPSSTWEAVPEPLVGRVLQFYIKKMSQQAEIVTNSAGMRSAYPYVPKDPHRFRIVCLGDSMVMGTAGKAEDRWGEQIEQLLRSRGVRVAGKEIEVYNLGIGSWSSLNEATYLAHRISSYQPDIVLVMMVDNDLNDVGGVLGVGQVTFGFTSEARQYGSGVMVDHWPQHFGIADKNLLSAGLGSESRGRWKRSFAAWKRLETLIQQSGGRMVFGVLKADPLFMELSKAYYVASGMKSPFIITDYFGERLPHDPHPNRAGHAILAHHYLHVLAKLGWLPIQPADLPPLHTNLTDTVEYAPDAQRILTLQKEVSQRTLHEAIQFDHLTKDHVLAMLGGIYPSSEEQPLEAPPVGTLKSIFLLKRQASAHHVVMEIEVPPYVELYPFQLDMLIDGVRAATLTVETPQGAGRHVIKGALPTGDTSAVAVEVMLRTEAYWTTIDNFTMQSYRLIAAWQE